MHRRTDVLNDRDLRTLAGIEQDLAASDPDLVRLFMPIRVGRISRPAVLFALGLATLVLGSVLGSIAVVMLGVAVTVVAMLRPQLQSLSTGPRRMTGEK